MYINCKTFFSLRYGTYSTKELVKTAADLGVTAIAITNINNTCDAWDLVKACREENIKPILGCEIRNGDQFCYLLLAANNDGFACINRFLSEHLLEERGFPADGKDIFKQGEGYVIYPPGGKAITDLEENERIGFTFYELNHLHHYDWKKYADKLVVRQPVTFCGKKQYSLHRLLRAIDKNTLLSKLGAETQAHPAETFIPPAALIEKFKLYPFMVTNTYRLMEGCHISMDFKVDKTKQTFGGNKEDDRTLLEKLALDGFAHRYRRNNKAALERLKKELKIIDKMGFNAYFLINWDIIRYAQSRGFYYVGRGSGANSIVAYCLKITDVDPIELNLFFERFLNPHRTSPPDFDIDFSWTDRDEVIDYVFKRYGREHVCLLGSYSTFQHDATIQQLGKVFGLPPAEIKTLQQTRRATDDIQGLILHYGKMLLNMPNILSLHPCGMLISELPVMNYAALWMPPKGFATAQMDMFVAEEIGLNKFDILSQRGLGHIKECQRLIRENKGIEVDIHQFEKFRNDPAVNTRIREANTIGCFYIESPAMRQLLKKLRCDDYITLVAASSIIRPGVAQSGMMREYIYRYHNRKDIPYLHPLFEEHLGETFGVMVFQEDVIKIAHFFAGLDLGEADILRRAMSGKYRSLNQFYLIRDKFLSNAVKLGHSESLAQEVWRQMESFAGYSFNKAHSASFAVESYMSLYLKTYYPKEFMVAVINNFGGFYSRELYFLELLKEGGHIHSPCVNYSDRYTNISNNDVYAGFIHIKSLQNKFIELLLQERYENGPYLHLQDFIERTNAGLEQLNTLISIGAFGFTGKSKKQLLWEANFLQKKHVATIPNTKPLFNDKPLQFDLPTLQDKEIDDLYDQMEILGFPLTNPFKLVDDDPEKYVPAAQLHAYTNKTVSVLAYFIARKHVTTKHRDQMFFGTFVDSKLDWIDTVHFPDQAKQYPFRSTGFYRIKGKVVEDFGAYSLEVATMQQVSYKRRSWDREL